MHMPSRGGDMRVPYMNLSRRRLLASLAAAGPLSALQGCLPRLPDDLCAPAGPVQRSNALLVDVHAHMINGSDLQIKEFFAKADGLMDKSWAGAAEEIGGILQLLQWTFAVRGSAELAWLDGFKCSEIPPANKISAMRKYSFEAGKSALGAAARRFQEEQLRPSGRKNFTFGSAGRTSIDKLLKQDYDEYEAKRRMRSGRAVPGRQWDFHITQKTADSMLDFVIQHFNPRYVNVIDYYDHYRTSSGETPDLVVASLLDFDWWLAMGCPTPTRIPQQIEVMQRISVLTGGRVHAFAPFCPLRELLTSRNNGDGESLKWVKDAVENRGFIGVKLYPPMGFALLGNEKIENANPVFWHRDWLPRVAWEQGFGGKLDDALRRLYVWCQKKDVPLMSHTSPSMGPRDFVELGGSEYWKQALEAYGNLRVNFGHFGGHSKIPTNAPGFVDLMLAKPNAYADNAYFFDAVDDDSGLKQHLLDVLKTRPVRVGERLMYGSDYLMIVMEQHWGEYLRKYRMVIRDINETLKFPGFDENFFGRNAAQYLGLHEPADGKPNNFTRLCKFYEDNRVPAPGWMAKLGLSCNR
jgi:predicted TIM-barrel fold metal-dependent hydrolase